MRRGSERGFNVRKMPKRYGIKVSKRSVQVNSVQNIGKPPQQLLIPYLVIVDGRYANKMSTPQHRVILSRGKALLYNR